MNRFMRGIYEGEVFLPSCTARSLSDSLYQFLHAYCYLASVSFQKGIPAWPMFPKLHAVHEIAFEMRRSSGVSEFVLNVAAHSCAMDEDMVGRVAALSRCVSPRAIAVRTLQRYLVHIQTLWARV